MPKGKAAKKSRKPESVKKAVIARRLDGASRRAISRELSIHRETVDNILNESQVEEVLAQCRREYLQLAPTALAVVKRVMLEARDAKKISRDGFGAALQILRGTGVHEERIRSRSDVRVRKDFTDESDEQLTDAIDQLLQRTQPQGTP